MNIALIGYGKMGKAIHQIAEERGHTITAIVDLENPIEKADFSNTDVAIEFSVPHQALKHIQFLLNKGIKTVVGTTGWNDHLPEVRDLVKSTEGGLVYASNFSVGVNLFMQLNEYLAQLMNPHKDYYVSMEEIHHTQKLDAPSGTAISLAEGIIQNHEAVNNWSCPQHPTKSEFNGGVEIQAVREPEVPGTHTVNYSSDIDTISITHQAHSRKGFATGSIVAAEWLIGKKGLFTMRDVLKIPSL